MALIPLTKWADREGLDRATCRQKALRGGFKTAVKLGRDWLIDEDEPKVDLRFKTGKYEGQHQKYYKRKTNPTE